MTPSGTRLTQYLLSLDDDSFFALYRNYRGPVETPYNKHDLVSDLRDFLARRETQSRIVTMLDDQDRMVLSAVEVFRAPDLPRLTRFLEDTFDYPALSDRVLNLKDRLLLINGTAAGTVEMNPVLRDAIRRTGLGTEYLVAGEPIPAHEQTTAAGPPWLTTPFAVALAAVLREVPDLFTRTGSVRKRAVTLLEDRFGELLSREDGHLRLRQAIVALETLGLVRHEAETVTVRPDSWDELAAVPDRWIQALLWGAVLASTVERAFAFAEVLIELTSVMAPDRSYTLGEVLRLVQLTAGGASLPVDRDTVFRLRHVGVLLEIDDRFRLNPTVPMVLDPGYAGTATARVQANMEVTVPPGCRYRDILVIGRLAELQRSDTVPTFVLTEAAVARARRDGIERPVEALTAVAGDLPQNVRFLLERWQKRAGAVRVLKATVVVAQPEEAATLRAAEDFRALIREEPAPGVFLVADDTRALQRILGRLELTAGTAIEGTRPVDVHVPEYDRLFQPYRQPSLIPREPTPREPHAGEPTDTDFAPAEGEDPRARLHEIVERAEIPEDVRQELALRVDRKLILFEEQIRGDVVPQYGIEARGLDYLGKIRLIEHAISNGDLLEVIMRARSGQPQRVLVQPREVVESGDDLMLRARQMPDLQAIRIRIRRISLVRRLSGTLVRRSGT